MNPINIDINHIVLIGTVTSPVDLRRTKNNKPWIMFRMITEERYRKWNGEDSTSKTTHTIKMWGAATERLSQVLRERSRVYVEGKVVNESYPDKNTGETRWITSVSAKKIWDLDAPQGAQQDHVQQSPAQQSPQQGYNQPAQQGAYNQPAQQAPPPQQVPPPQQEQPAPAMQPEDALPF